MSLDLAALSRMAGTDIPDDKAWLIGAARAHVLGWAAYTDPTYKFAPHLRYVANYLHRVESGDLRRVIFALPARHGKSTLVSVKFVGWFLGRNPDARVIIAAHTAELAERFSAYVRADLQAFGKEVFGITVSPESKARDRWDIEGHRGGVLAVGVLGAALGWGADLVSIDDPLHDPAQLRSEAELRRVQDWYRAVIRTRLHPGGRIVVTASRFGLNDFTGWLLDQQASGGEAWEYVRIPVIAGENDPLGRRPGEPLWPEMFPLDELERIRAGVGEVNWQAQYMQDPIPDTGQRFRAEWFRFLESRPSMGYRWVRCWDLAAATGTRADYTAGALVGADDDGNLVIADVTRWIAPWPETRRRLKAVMRADGPGVAVGIEKVAFQLAAVQDLLADPDLIGFSIRPVAVDRDKEARADVWAARAEAGKVALVRGPWNREFLDEVTAFPRGRHDDQVDAVSLAVQLLGRRASEPVLTHIDLPW